VGIGGVLEPLQANPTIIEDNCFIGARSEVVEGVDREENSVLGMGVYLGRARRSTIVRRVRSATAACPGGIGGGRGNLPATDGSHSLTAPVIVKKVDAKTRRRPSLNELASRRDAMAVDLEKRGDSRGHAPRPGRPRVRAARLPDAARQGRHHRPRRSTGSRTDYMVNEQHTRSRDAQLRAAGTLAVSRRRCARPVNHVVCHGIPGDKKLKDGDIVNIDVTVIKDGYHGDTSRMFTIGKPSIQARGSST
jgi:hypothetical protein